MDELVARLIRENERLARDNKALREELASIRAGMFGRKREHIDPNQLLIFQGGQEAISDDAGEGAAIVVERHVRKKKAAGHGRESFPDHLPREVIEHDVPESDRICPDCGDAMKPMGEDVCERGHYVPATLVVRQHRKKKYGCPKGHCVKTAAAPAALIDRCKYEPSVYAHIATAKYCDHVPLHRMSGIFKRHGVNLPKQTMWDMLVRVDELLAQPILKVMQKEVLQTTFLYADETPVTCRYGPKAKGTFQGYFWLYRDTDDRSVCDFRISRARDGPTNFLASWPDGGTLIADGYSGYDEIVAAKGIVRAGCWAHARRKIFKVAQQRSRDISPLLALVDRLFGFERALKKIAKRRGLTRVDFWHLRFQRRRRYYGTLFAKIREQVETLWSLRTTTASSLTGKALTYIDRQWERLTQCRADGRIEIHNNDTERAIRHIAVGR
ncbi:MAG: IS66 family transposase, partial [Salinibacterium sp.]|nr:IS66 family transposase [Salinibacterium sp.]